MRRIVHADPADAASLSAELSGDRPASPIETPSIEDDPRTSPAVMDIVKRLQSAIASAPEAHFRTLDERLAAKLAPAHRLESAAR